MCRKIATTLECSYPVIVQRLGINSQDQWEFKREPGRFLSTLLTFNKLPVSFRGLIVPTLVGSFNLGKDSALLECDVWWDCPRITQYLKQ